MCSECSVPHRVFHLQKTNSGSKWAAKLVPQHISENFAKGSLLSACAQEGFCSTGTVTRKLNKQLSDIFDRLVAESVCCVSWSCLRQCVMSSGMPLSVSVCSFVVYFYCGYIAAACAVLQWAWGILAACALLWCRQ